jgi:2-methylcitrate dehydratase PrpD
LGTRWRLVDPGLLFKTSPVCSAAHAAIEQMAILMNEAGANAQAINSIEAEVPDLVDISLIYPHPITPQEAQFSLHYALACSALHGKVTLEDLEPNNIRSEEKTELIKKVTVRVSSDLSTSPMLDKYPESARLKVSFSDGRQFSGFCGEAYGMPKRPLSNKDLLVKFHKCIGIAGDNIDAFEFESVDLLKLANKILHYGVDTHSQYPKEETSNCVQTASQY